MHKIHLVPLICYNLDMPRFRGFIAEVCPCLTATLNSNNPAPVHSSGTFEGVNELQHSCSAKPGYISQWPSAGQEIVARAARTDTSLVSISPKHVASFTACIDYSMSTFYNLFNHHQRSTTTGAYSSSDSPAFSSENRKSHPSFSCSVACSPSCAACREQP